MINRYLQSYIDEGYFLRIKDLVLLDYYIDNENNLYLKLNNPDDVIANNTDFISGYDLNIYDPFVLKIKNENFNIQISIVKAFESYHSELSYITILFNKNNFFEINEHNGIEMEEGWYSSFGDFKYEAFEIYSCHKEKKEFFYSISNYLRCSELIKNLKDLNITIMDYSDSVIVNLKFERIIKLLNLAVNQVVPETIDFLNGYFLKRPDNDYKRKNDGEKFENAILICKELINNLQKIKK